MDKKNLEKIIRDDPYIVNVLNLNRVILRDFILSKEIDEQNSFILINNTFGIDRKIKKVSSSYPLPPIGSEYHKIKDLYQSHLLVVMILFVQNDYKKMVDYFYKVIDEVMIKNGMSDFSIYDESCGLIELLMNVVVSKRFDLHPSLFNYFVRNKYYELRNENSYKQIAFELSYIETEYFDTFYRLFKERLTKNNEVFYRYFPSFSDNYNSTHNDIHGSSSTGILYKNFTYFINKFKPLEGPKLQDILDKIQDPIFPKSVDSDELEYFPVNKSANKKSNFLIRSDGFSKLEIDSEEYSWFIKLINSFEEESFEFSTYKNFDRIAPVYSKQKIWIDYLRNLKEGIEELIRAEHNIPEKHSKLISETKLFNILQAEFSNEKIERHSSPTWLGRQHLDIYFPDYNVGIEYQGQQHFEPIEFFGGEEAFKKTVARDKRKKKLCEQNKCQLIYVLPGYDKFEVIKKIESIIK